MKDKTPHLGHRERMRARLRVNGAASMAEHERMELLLFYAIARRNTNPLAHRLIARFGGMDAILHADRRDLLAINGVGEGTADFLKSIGAIVDLLNAERAAKDKAAKNG